MDLPLISKLDDHTIAKKKDGSRKKIALSSLYTVMILSRYKMAHCTIKGSFRSKPLFHRLSLSDSLRTSELLIHDHRVACVTETDLRLI